MNAANGPATSANSQTAELLNFLNRLDAARLHYRLGHYREESITVEIAIPGERWEIDFLANGQIEVERFRSDGHMADHTALDELFRDDAA